MYCGTENIEVDEPGNVQLDKKTCICNLIKLYLYNRVYFINLKTKYLDVQNTKP